MIDEVLMTSLKIRIGVFETTTRWTHPPKSELIILWDRFYYNQMNNDDLPIDYSEEWCWMWEQLILYSPICIRLISKPTDKMVELHKMMHEI